MAGFSYNGSLLGRSLREPQGAHSVVVEKAKKRIRGVFRFEATPLLFADVDVDYYFDIKQTALELNVTPRTIARYRVDKQLPVHSLNKRKNLFRKSVIDRIKNAV